MKSIYKTILILFSLVFLTVGCKTEEATIVKIDEKFCKEVNLPEIAFSLSCPSTLQKNIATKEENYNYVDFYKTSGSLITETLGITYYVPIKDEEEQEAFKKEILKDLFATYQETFNIDELNIDKDTIDGKEYFVGRAIGNTKNEKLKSGLKGKYLIQGMIVEPEQESESGLFLLFMANENSSIKTFEDLTSKGDIGIVWKSLKFKD